MSEERKPTMVITIPKIDGAGGFDYAIALDWKLAIAIISVLNAMRVDPDLGSVETGGVKVRSIRE